MGVHVAAGVSERPKGCSRGKTIYSFELFEIAQITIPDTAPPTNPPWRNRVNCRLVCEVDVFRERAANPCRGHTVRLFRDEWRILCDVGRR